MLYQLDNLQFLKLLLFHASLIGWSLICVKHVLAMFHYQNETTKSLYTYGRTVTTALLAKVGGIGKSHDNSNVTVYTHTYFSDFNTKPP